MSQFDRVAKLIQRQPIELRTEFYSNTREPLTREYNANQFLRKLLVRSILTGVEITVKYI